MKDQRYVWNPFRILSPKLDLELGKMEGLYEMPVSSSYTPEEALIIMVSKLIEMMKILSNWFESESPGKLEECDRLAHEVREYEKLATAGIVESSAAIGQNVFRLVVRFPSRMERIGTMCTNILHSCRIKANEGIPFSDKALSELRGLFSHALDMIRNLRDSLVVPNKVLLEHIKEQADTTVQLVEDSRLRHWNRLEAGFCAPAASPLYLEILDSFKFISEYVRKMDDSLLVLTEQTGEST
jgi:Na+/phosphate symporter